MISEGSFMDPNYAYPSSFDRKRELSTFKSTATNKFSGTSRELFGFRRKAREYLEATTQRYRDLYFEKSSRGSSQKEPRRILKAVGEKDEMANSKRIMDMLFDKANEKNFELKQILERDSYGTKYGVHISTTPRSVPDLVCEPNFQDAKAEITMMSPTAESIELNGNENRRVILFHDLPIQMGIRSLLTQLRGGPLDKIFYAFENKLTCDKIAYVEIHFLFPQDAQNFMRFSRFHLFKVNGIHLIPQWANKELSEFSNSSLEDIREYYQEDLCRHIQNFDSVGARRTLIMKKYSKKHKSICKESHSNMHIYELDISQIKADFSKFGTILDINPLISRKICLQISFSDIRSAIDAMESYETTSSFINEKYHRDWSIWYGKDIVDRPCIDV